MIEITPDIMGPGIEEEYADALAAIADLRRALGERKLTNETPDGRLLLEVAWVEQEIRRQRLPIPVARSYAGTIYYLVGSGELDRVVGVKSALGRLWLVLKGYGLLKQRHVPVLIAMMDDFVAEAVRCSHVREPKTARLIADMRSEEETLRGGGAWPRNRRPQDQFMLQVTPALRACMERCSGRATEIDASLFEGWRPRPARKPPLTAPVPGLPPDAPPLPPEFQGRLP